VKGRTSRPIAINNNGQIVGGFSLDSDALLITPIPNPAPPAGTTVDMILHASNTGPTVFAHQYEIYDIGNNAILAGYQLGTVGTEWQHVGLGNFFGSDTTDMLFAQQQHGGIRGLRHQ
jgi:hypothetical protein